jgi:hypothetical protein
MNDHDDAFVSAFAEGEARSRVDDQGRVLVELDD